METTTRIVLLLACTLLVSLAGLGCNGENPYREEPTAAQPAAPAKPLKSEDTAPKQTVPAKRAALGKGVWLETQGDRRRVLVNAVVCLRQGDFGLECLLCKKGTKEHESILATEADARLIHAGLLAAKAEPGSPVQYIEKGDKFITVPPSGDRIKVSIQYHKDGKQVTVPAQSWIRDAKSGKNLKHDWVFAGSRFYANPENEKEKLYAATSEGAYICTSNVLTAMLDLPLDSPKAIEARECQPYTDRIPPLETKVTIILEPVPAEKKPEKK